MESNSFLGFTFFPCLHIIESNHCIIMRMKMSKKILSIFLLLVFAITMIPANGVSAKTKVKLNKTNITLTTGDTCKLKVSGTKAKVKWSSSNQSVAKVSKTGLVSAKGEGTARIVAKVGKKKYYCKVTVETEEDDVERVYGKLVDYIMSNGVTNSSGFKVINGSYDEYLYGIEYDSKQDAVVFILVNQDEELQVAVTMTISLSDTSTADVYYICVDESTGCKAYASFETETYDDFDNMEFDVITAVGMDNDDVQSYARSDFSVSMECWDIFLDEKMGLTFDDFGFNYSK